MTGVKVSLSQQRLNQIYDKIPTNIIYGFRMFLALLGILAFMFTGLQIEELVIGCSGGLTLLQRSAFSMDFNGVCEDPEFMKWSYITIFASGLYGLTMMMFGRTVRDAWVQRMIDKTPKNEATE